MNEAEFIITLSLINGLGNKKIYNLVKKYHFDFQTLYQSIKDELNEKQYIEYENSIDMAKHIYKTNTIYKISVITLFDERFPSSLYKTKKPCILLYYIGDIDLLSSKCVTIIGTRHPDNGFINKGKVAVKKIVEEGYTIVSGLALGSDTLAHKECLANGGKTIAIMPCSLDKINPPSNRDLAIEILKNGGLLISEYPYGEKFNKYAYAERDRLQAYLSNFILVIQSTDNGGTMIAVREAASEGKKVFAIKGNEIFIIRNYIDPLDDSFISSLKSHTKEEKDDDELVQLSFF